MTTEALMQTHAPSISASPSSAQVEKNNMANTSESQKILSANAEAEDVAIGNSFGHAQSRTNNNQQTFVFDPEADNRPFIDTSLPEKGIFCFGSENGLPLGNNKEFLENGYNNGSGFTFRIANGRRHLTSAPTVQKRSKLRAPRGESNRAAPVNDKANVNNSSPTASTTATNNDAQLENSGDDDATKPSENATTSGADDSSNRSSWSPHSPPVNSISVIPASNSANPTTKRSKRKKDQAFSTTLDQEDSCGYTEPDTNIDGSLLNTTSQGSAGNSLPASAAQRPPQSAPKQAHHQSPSMVPPTQMPPQLQPQPQSNNVQTQHPHGLHQHAHFHTHNHGHVHPHSHSHHVPHSHHHSHASNPGSPSLVPKQRASSPNPGSATANGPFPPIKHSMKVLPSRMSRPLNQADLLSRPPKIKKVKKKPSQEIQNYNQGRDSLRLAEARRKKSKLVANKKWELWEEKERQERERIKEFWLSLTDAQRRELVKLEKEAVLKKMKEQQKHTCSCSVCGRRRTVIEEELEMLYDAYYEELEHYEGDNKQKNAQLKEPQPTEDSDEDVNFNFAKSLTVKGGILTVADDLLKNEGKKFLEMMEKLAERRMRKEEESEEYEDETDEEYEYDDEEDEEDEEDEDEEDEDEEGEEDDIDNQQRLEEGRRMFQMFAAKMFEQRVLSAYREKVAYENQKKLIQEEEEEERQKQAQKESKLRKAKLKKEKRKQAKQALEDKKEQKKKEDEQKEKERQEQLKRQQQEEQRRKKEEEKKKQLEEQRLEQERQEQLRLAKENEEKRRQELQKKQEKQKEKKLEAKRQEELKKQEAQRQKQLEEQKRKEELKKQEAQRQKQLEEQKKQEAEKKEEGKEESKKKKKKKHKKKDKEKEIDESNLTSSILLMQQLQLNQPHILQYQQQLQQKQAQRALELQQEEMQREQAAQARALKGNANNEQLMNQGLYGKHGISTMMPPVMMYPPDYDLKQRNVHAYPANNMMPYGNYNALIDPLPSTRTPEDDEADEDIANLLQNLIPEHLDDNATQEPEEVTDKPVREPYFVPPIANFATPPATQPEPKPKTGKLNSNAAAWYPPSRQTQWTDTKPTNKNVLWTPTATAANVDATYLANVGVLPAVPSWPASAPANVPFSAPVWNAPLHALPSESLSSNATWAFQPAPQSLSQGPFAQAFPNNS